MTDFEKYTGQLEGNRLIFRQLLSSVSTDDARWKQSGDRWSVLEVLCHVRDIEIEDFRRDLHIILYEPDTPWPRFDEMEWVSERRYNEQNFGDVVDSFLAERDKSVSWLKSLGSPDLHSLHSGKGMKGKPKSAGDILVSWIAHDYFHIRQLALLRFALLNRVNQDFSPSYSGFYT